jgi:hypothetical protein
MPLYHARINECGHPERKHRAFGLCDACYKKTPHQQTSIKVYTDKHSLRDRLKHRYNITIDQYNALNEQQHGLCAICGQPPRGKMKRLSVDHDHITGKVRGLLCITCNRVLGYIENAEWCRQADVYLKSAHTIRASRTLSDLDLP